MNKMKSPMNISGTSQALSEKLNRSFYSVANIQLADGVRDGLSLLSGLCMRERESATESSGSYCTALEKPQTIKTNAIASL